MLNEQTRRALETIAGNRKRLPELTRQWAQTARDEGATWAEIAQALDVTVQGLMRAMKRAAE